MDIYSCNASSHKQVSTNNLPAQLISYCVLSGNLTLHGNICTLVSLLNKSLVAAGCLQPQPLLSFYLQSPHQCCMRSICIPLISAFHPRFHLPCLFHLHPPGQPDSLVHRPHHHCPCCPLCSQTSPSALLLPSGVTGLLCPILLEDQDSSSSH